MLHSDDTIKTAKAHYEDKLVDQLQTNPKRFWNYTRHFTRSSATVDTLQHEGKTYTEDDEKASIVNDFFTSVLINEAPPIYTLLVTPNADNVLLDIEKTPEMIRI